MYIQTRSDILKSSIPAYYVAHITAGPFCVLVNVDMLHTPRRLVNFDIDHSNRTDFQTQLSVFSKNYDFLYYF